MTKIYAFPSEVWGKILTFIEFPERIPFCEFLINTGLVKLTSNMFVTYMNLLDESKKNDERNVETVFINLDDLDMFD